MHRDLPGLAWKGGRCTSSRSPWGRSARPSRKIGIEVTDSPYVVANMMIMTRDGYRRCWRPWGQTASSSPVCTRSAPLWRPVQDDVPWPCERDPKHKYIVHFPEDPSIWSYGSGYGGNALLGKKCLALRIASAVARKEGWLAEHMLILALTSPEGKKHYIAGAFPSACGKTNLAMMLPTLPGWKVTCLGDDIAWMRIGEDGRLYAMNPETGFFGVAPGTSYDSNPNAMESFTRNSIFTNAALTDDGDVWWEEMGVQAPAHLIDWEGKDWTPDAGRKAAHPELALHRSRRAVSRDRSRLAEPGGRAHLGHPVWRAAAAHRPPGDTKPSTGSTGCSWARPRVRRPRRPALGKAGFCVTIPSPCCPFCGYNMGDYFAHWLSMAGPDRRRQAAAIFFVNWFRKGEDGHWLWPGYGENSRVLKWIFERVEGNGKAVETPIGNLPTPDALDLSGLDMSRADDLKTLLTVDTEGWKKEAAESRRCTTMDVRRPASCRSRASVAGHSREPLARNRPRREVTDEPRASGGDR